MRDVLTEGGVPADRILLEDTSRTTLENAENAMALMKTAGLTEAVVVTDRYHCPRAWLTFRALGLRVHMISAASAPPHPRLGVSLKAWARECVALPVYAVRLMLRRR